MGLSFANRYTAPVSICILWYNRDCGGHPWRKTGWWNLNSNQSVQVLSGSLNNRYYCFYARAADGAIWGGDYSYLVTANRFNVCQDDILEPSFMVGMRIVDTGDADDFTISLVT